VLGRGAASAVSYSGGGVERTRSASSEPWSGPIEFTTLEIVFMAVVAVVLSAIVIAYMLWVRTKKFR
jgi:hypothetical protein